MSELEFWKDLGGIFDAVMNYQKKNVEFNNNFINPWIRLGNIFERQDQSNDAVQAYQRAIAIDPDTAQNWVNLGDTQFRNGAHDEAIEAYRKAVTLDPEAGWPLGNLALSLVTQGKIEEAIPLYKKSIDLLIEVKDKAICWNRLGNAYRKLNDYENAFLAFQKADELDGENTGFKDNLDETPPSSPVIAPEEILEQMIVDQALEEHKAESRTSEAELTTQVETAEERIVLAPYMETINEERIEEEVELYLDETGVEEPAGENPLDEEETPLMLHEKNFNFLQAVENVIAKVEETFAKQENSDTGKVEAAVPNEASEDAPHSIPAWLVIRDNVKAQEKKSASEAGVEQERAQLESVTTLSGISQESAVNELVVNMNVVETYTDPLTATLMTQPNLSEEAIREAVDQTKHRVEREVEAERHRMITADESDALEQSSAAIAEEQQAELAYEEYLKDVVEPTNILTDHMDEIQSEVPVTKVSINGDVRIVMDTKNAHVWNELGNIYLNAGACEDAIASYSKAIELDRHFAWPYSNLALAYVQKSRFAEAILLYQRGIELFTTDKDKAITWNRLGNVYRRINDYGNAIASYQTADELDPENTTLSLRSSFGLLGNNKHVDSKPAYVA